MTQFLLLSAFFVNCYAAITNQPGDIVVNTGENATIQWQYDNPSGLNSLTWTFTDTSGTAITIMIQSLSTGTAAPQNGFSCVKNSASNGGITIINVIPSREGTYSLTAMYLLEATDTDSVKVSLAGITTTTQVTTTTTGTTTTAAASSTFTTVSTSASQSLVSAASSASSASTVDATAVLANVTVPQSDSQEIVLIVVPSVVGSLLVVVCLITSFLCLRKRNRQNKHQNSQYPVSCQSKKSQHRSTWHDQKVTTQHHLDPYLQRGDIHFVGLRPEQSNTRRIQLDQEAYNPRFPREIPMHANYAFDRDSVNLPVKQHDRGVGKYSEASYSHNWL